MNNKGISIAVNQVVLLLIGIVILGLGLAFVAKVMTVAEHTLPSIDSKMEDQLRTKLGRDNVVELTRSVQKIKAKDLAIFNLGIVNDPRISTGEEFTIILNYDHAINKKGDPICGSGTNTDCYAQMTSAILVPDLELLGSTGKFEKDYTIKENELKIVTIGIAPKDNPKYAGPGQYFFNICVCEGLICGESGNRIDRCNPSSFQEAKNGYGFKTFSVIVE